MRRHELAAVMILVFGLAAAYFIVDWGTRSPAVPSAGMEAARVRSRLKSLEIALRCYEQSIGSIAHGGAAPTMRDLAHSGCLPDELHRGTEDVRFPATIAIVRTQAGYRVIATPRPAMAKLGVPVQAVDVAISEGAD